MPASLDLWAIVTAVVMILALFAGFVPFVPGPALVWAIGIVYAIATGLENVGLVTVILMTVFVLIGSTADWWTRYLGFKTNEGGSCLQFTVSIVGGILGTFFIPIPILGTLIGAAGAVMLMEMSIHEGSFQDGLRAARIVAAAWLASFFVEAVTSLLIVVIFISALFA